ncbi:tripeptidyl-peptidase II [Malassezia caprae]|uniref:tripeptidyl-peptidase II n=1 Tax=Malassezia caprae TaxID=1381934 RepID=A0AAF0E701_9BASI|nr:tripeptidyl-peptidase II [Malassezia caprae]
MSTIAEKPAFPIAGLLPKQATKADAFVAKFPQYDGRGVRVAVLDTGVDPAALGLDGPNKLVDVIDCTGAGDVPLTAVEATEADGGKALAVTSPHTGRQLLLSPSWPNPSGVWKVGMKRAYDLWPKELVERRTSERRRAFDVSHAQALQQALQRLAAEEQAPSDDKDASAQRREELEARVAVLKDMHKAWCDPGPILEAVVFHDGTHWRAVVGGAEGDVADAALGEPAAVRAAALDLRARPPLTDFRIERQWARFGERDLLSYTVNILNDGALLSIVTVSGTHGTHVAGIIGARTDEAATNGVAPGAEIVSLRIGDARLGSMEQGQALLRAAQALIDTRCDVANMSYGEDGAFFCEDKGAFAHALQRVIREHGVCFVSSAGNNGPALTTVGQPGGTTSGVLSVGAYVSEGAMQQAEYALVEAGVPSSVTTWCSRGPTADGAAGVSIYAPGAAITSICQYALQSKQLMNGTSMSSPNAAGAVALLVSACKAEGIPATPFRVFRAIEATGADVGDPLGVRFLDVEQAWAYLVAHRDDPYADAEMQVRVTRAGKPLGACDARGVYLRGVEETHRTSQYHVTVQPRFRDGETQRAFALEIRAALRASAPWVQVPEFLALGSQGRTFEIRVAAGELPPGLHSAQIVGVDTERPGTAVFTVPITVAKPVVPTSATHTFARRRLASGEIQRTFVHVPSGATSAEVRVRSRAHEAPGTSVRFWLHLLQVQPQRRLSQVEHQYVLALNEDEPVTKQVSVQPGQTLEVCAAQFWSNKAGFELDMELEFHGLQVPRVVTAHSSAGWHRVDVANVLRVEECKPKATLETRRTYVRPTKHTVRPRLEARDQQPSGHALLELVAEYPVVVKEATSLTWRVPLSGYVYDASVTLLTQLLDKSHAQVAFGDVYPKAVSLRPGEYVLRIQALHESAAVLERLQDMPVALDEKLKKEISLDVYADHVDLLGAAPPCKEGVKLLKGERTVVVLDTSLSGESWPADAAPGDVLLGTLAFSAHTKVPLNVVVGPAPPKPAEGGAAEPTPLPAQLAALAPKVPDADKDAFVARLVSEYPDDLAVRLAALDAAKGDAKRTLEAAQGVCGCVDETALRQWFGAQRPPASEQTADEKKRAKEMSAQKKALAKALTRQAQAHAELGDRAASVEATMYARQWVDSSDTAAKTALTNLLIEWHRDHERFGQALQAVRQQLEQLGHGTPETLADLHKAQDLETALLAQLGWDVWHHYAQRWTWLRRPKAPEPF